MKISRMSHRSMVSIESNLANSFTAYISNAELLPTIRYDGSGRRVDVVGLFREKASQASSSRHPRTDTGRNWIQQPYNQAWRVLAAEHSKNVLEAINRLHVSATTVAFAVQRRTIQLHGNASIMCAQRRVIFVMFAEQRDPNA